MAFWFAQPQSDSKWTWPASRDLQHPEAARARKRRFETCYLGAPSAALVVIIIDFRAKEVENIIFVNQLSKKKMNTTAVLSIALINNCSLKTAHYVILSVSKHFKL